MATKLLGLRLSNLPLPLSLVQLCILLSSLAVIHISTPAIAFRAWGKVELLIFGAPTSIEKRIAALAAQGQLESALDLDNRAIERDKDNTILHLMRMQLYEALMQEDKFTSELKLFTTLPASKEQLQFAIDLSDRLEELEVGVQLGERYIKLFGDSVTAAPLVTARMYWRIGNHARAEQLLVKLIKNNPNKEFPYMELVRVYSDWKKPEKVIATASEALNSKEYLSNKTKMLLRVQRATAFSQTKKYKDALADYNVLILTAPSLPNLYNQRAEVLEALGQRKQAAADRLKQKQLDSDK